MAQQLVKKGSDRRYSNVMSKSWIEAIKDKLKIIPFLERHLCI